jgi:phage repressor protein C with HTH and peptisase S24 domain
MKKHPGKLVPRSDNKDYDPVYLGPGEMGSFRVIGKVVWISRDVK